MSAGKDKMNLQFKQTEIIVMKKDGVRGDKWDHNLSPGHNSESTRDRYSPESINRRRAVKGHKKK